MTRKRTSLPLRCSKKMLRVLDHHYPDATCSLRYGNELELLIATVLSAQCTDERVNLVTKDLFRKYRSARAYARAPLKALEADIRSAGFYRNKALAIQGIARAVLTKHKGKVPETMEALVALPGVGRKTANVVLGNAFGKNEGVVVDTHIGRLSQRMGFTRHRTPEKIEQDLIRLVPRRRWTKFSHQMIQHGRRICTARKPNCAGCFLKTDCPSATLLGVLK